MYSIGPFTDDRANVDTASNLSCRDSPLHSVVSGPFNGPCVPIHKCVSGRHAVVTVFRR